MNKYTKGIIKDHYENGSTRFKEIKGSVQTSLTEEEFHLFEAYIEEHRKDITLPGPIVSKILADRIGKSPSYIRGVIAKGFKVMKKGL